MRKILIALLALGSISTAMADTYYERVKSLFESGSVPRAKDLVGTNVGRCFLRENPYSVGSGFALLGRIDHTDAGPIDANQLVAVALVSDQLSYFDNAPIKDIWTRKPLLPVRRSDSELLVDNKVYDSRQIVTLRVRENGSYLVVSLGTYMYCYTYLKR